VPVLSTFAALAVNKSSKYAARAKPEHMLSFSQCMKQPWALRSGQILCSAVAIYGTLL